MKASIEATRLPFENVEIRMFWMSEFGLVGFEHCILGWALLKTLIARIGSVGLGLFLRHPISILFGKVTWIQKKNSVALPNLRSQLS